MIIANGSKIERATDFSTHNGLMEISRIYRHAMGASRKSVAFGDPRGLGKNWRFNFTMEMHIDSGFRINGAVTLLMSDGSEYSFSRQSDGSVIARDLDANQVPYQVAFDGPWPADLRDISENPVKWWVTDPEGRKFHLQSFKRYSDESLYLVARPIDIIEPNGTTRTYQYGANDELVKITDSFGREFNFTWLMSPETAATPLAIELIALPDGTKLRYSYDSVSPPSPAGVIPERLIKVERLDAADAVIDTTSYHYENTDYPLALTGITDAKGVRFSTWTYDTHGRVTSSEHANGTDRYTFSYDDTLTDTHRIVTNPLGKQSIYRYSRHGTRWDDLRLTGVDGQASANCPASANSIVYDNDRYVSETTDEEGRITKYVRNSRDLPTSITEGFGTPEARTITYTWHATFRLPTQKVEPGLTTDYTYDSARRLTQKTQTDTTTHTVPYSTNGQTRTWTYTYTTEGLLDTVDGPLPGAVDVIDYDYDANGDLAKITNELGHVTTIISTNTRGQPTSFTDGNAIPTDLEYDDLGRLITSTVNPGATQAVTAYTYDAIDQIKTITRPGGEVLTYTYDDARRLTSVVNGLGERMDYSYDLMGNITGRTVKKSDGTLTFTLARTYDELGRLLQSIGAVGQTTQNAYDKTDNLVTITDPRGNSNQFGFDALQRLIQETNEENAQVNLTRDGRDNITAYKDPRNLQTDYVRNGFDEIIRQVSPDSGTTDTVRNELGLATQITDARGVVTNNSYDALGRMLSTSYPAAPAENITYTYDDTANNNPGIGRMTGTSSQSGSTSYTYDVRGNIIAKTSTIGAQTYQLVYAYDLSDRMIETTYPSGRIVTYARDSEGRITSVTTRRDINAAPVTLASNITWQPLVSNLTGLTYGNNFALTQSYTQDQVLDQVTLTNGATVLIDRTHGYDANLNVTALSDSADAAQNQSFAYSPANRLTGSTGAFGRRDFEYDALGNRTARITERPGQTENRRDYTYPVDSNRLIEIAKAGVAKRSFTHDATGNVLTDTRLGVDPNRLIAYTYNQAGRLATSSIDGNLRAQFTYNARSQMAVRDRFNQTPSGGLHMLYDEAGQLLVEAKDDGQHRREYIWLGNSHHLLAHVKGAWKAAPNLYFVHNDHQNRPLKMSDSTGQIVWSAVHWPFGKPFEVVKTKGLRLRFPGQWAIGGTGGTGGLSYNWNRFYDPKTGRYTRPDPLGFIDGPSVYAYVGGNPMGFVDPTGELYLADFILGVGDFNRNYSNMVAANTIGADKYFHCKANCEAAQRGTGGSNASWCISEGRELVDQYIKGYSAADSAADQRANRYGRSTGGNSQTRSCKSICSSFRPTGLHPQY